MKIYTFVSNVQSAKITAWCHYAILKRNFTGEFRENFAILSPFIDNKWKYRYVLISIFMKFREAASFWIRQSF